MHNISIENLNNRKENIGKRIKHERNKLNLTQDDFKAKIYISSRQTIARWENGSTLPTLSDLLAMCELFECELGYLLCEYDCKTRANTDVSNETGLSEKAINRIGVSCKDNGMSLVTSVRKAERKALNDIIEFNDGDILRLVTRFLYPDEIIEVKEFTDIQDSALCLLELSEELHALKAKIRGGSQ